MHQGTPTTPGSSKEPVLMAPNFSKKSLVKDKFEQTLRKLKEVLPNTPKTRLEALITEENGNLEAIVS